MLRRILTATAVLLPIVSITIWASAGTQVTAAAGGHAPTVTIIEY